MTKLLVSCLMCMIACNMAIAESFTFANRSINESVSDYTNQYITRGSISYDYDNNVLTLNNVDITYTDTGSGSALILFSDNVHNFTIKLVGENHIVCETTFLDHVGTTDVNIEGPGSLDINSSYYYGIRLGDWYDEKDCTLTIKDCDLKINSTRESINGSQADTAEAGVLTVVFDNVNAELHGYKSESWKTFYFPAINNIKDIVLKNCAIAEPVNAYIGTYTQNKCIVEDVDGETRGVQKLVITTNTAGICQQTIKNNPTTIKRVNNRNQLEIEKNGYIYNETGSKIR